MTRASGAWGIAAAVASIVVLSGCKTEPIKTAAPPIRTLSRQNEPSKDVLPIIPSEQVAADPQKALENYQKLLDLNADPAIRSEAMRRVASLNVQVEDNKGNPDDSGALQRSIDIYQQLLKENPSSPGNDDVLYQMARAFQNKGDTDQSIETLRRLEKQFPNSQLIADARFRNAELLYQRKRYPEAEQEYRSVMAFGQRSPFFEPAQYKLGWSLFKQQRYEDDIAVFFDILGRVLPPGELEDSKSSLDRVAPAKADLARDSLHVTSLSFAALGGGKALHDYFGRHGEPTFYPLVYNALGDYFLEKHRYSDAANAYAAFVDVHPSSPRAPTFQTRVIAAYQEGGFNDLVAREKERYVTLYAPSAPYWNGRAPTAEVTAALRLHLEDLGRHYQARAQLNPQKDSLEARADFLAAAGWYQKTLQIFPNDPNLPQINLLYADALYDGGQTREAAVQYDHTAFAYPGNAKASEAAFASVQAYQRLAKEVPPAERAAVLSDSVSESLKFADNFPNQPQTAAVLTRAAEDLLESKQPDQAVQLANRVLQSNPPANADLRGQALGVIADARFSQGNFAESENAYGELQKLTPPGDPRYKVITDQLAASIYKQGEAARSAGDLRAAAGFFQRVGVVAPDAAIRPNADYDAATALLGLQDWPAAEQVLEGFRSRYPSNPLAADADKQLASAYQKDGKPAQAAAAYQRIAARGSEQADTRSESAWLAAKLYDDAHQPAAAASAYADYVRAYPVPLDRATQARRRLADLALASNDQTHYRSWLQEIVDGDDTGGGARSDLSKGSAAQANLELGKIAEADARNVHIGLPLNKTLPLRKKATEAAVQYLNRAAGYGFAGPTTAATYELGTVYQDFGKALRDSDRPHNLKPEEREQYDLLLEEQATPFDDQAIQAHEANLARVKQGLWNDSVRQSVDALASLAPAKYGKREQREEIYETLR